MSDGAQRDKSSGVLVVEDDESIALLVRRIIERRGAPATTAETAGRALILLDQQSWTVVLTDIWLPDMSGLDLITHVKEEHPGLPIVAMSADSLGDQALARGAEAFFMKPFTPADLWSHLQPFVEKGGPREMSPQALLSSTP